jgi:hypothetical protein
MIALNENLFALQISFYFSSFWNFIKIYGIINKNEEK